MTQLGEDAPQLDDRARSLSVPVSGGAQTLIRAVRELDANGIHLLDVGLRRPTLDDVFLSLTGQRAETDDDEAAPGSEGST